MVYRSCKSTERWCSYIAVRTQPCTKLYRWSSICRGATLWGLEHSDLTSLTSTPTVVSRLSRYNYGMAFSQIYDPSRHLLQDMYMDPAEGVYRARGQMIWLLRRVRQPKRPTTLVRMLTATQGEEVEEGRVLDTSCINTVEVGFRDSGVRQFTTNLWYNEENKPPTRKTDGRSPWCPAVHAEQC